VVKEDRQILTRSLSKISKMLSMMLLYKFLSSLINTHLYQRNYYGQSCFNSQK